MNFETICTLLLLIFTVKVSSEGLLPDGFVKCKLSDPNIDECQIKSVQSILNHVSKGIPSIGIPPLESLTVPKVKLVNKAGPVQLEIIHENSIFRGLSDVQLISFKGSDWKNHLTVSDVYFPHVITNSTYEIKGKLLTFPVRGKGDCSIEIHGLHMHFRVEMTVIERNGKHYLKPKTLKVVDSSVKSGRARYDNLFNGDKILGEATNKAINDNFLLIFQEFKPMLNQMFQNQFGDYIIKFYDNLPLEDFVEM